MSSLLFLNEYIDNKKQWQGSTCYLLYTLDVFKKQLGKTINYELSMDENSHYQNILKINSQPEAKIINVIINAPGLIGEQTTLPCSDRYLLTNGDHQSKKAMTKLMNIFNHKIIELFYHSWCHNRLVMSYKIEESTKANHNVHDFLKATAGLSSLETPLDYYLITQGLYLRSHHISSSLLESLFMDYFKLPLKIKPMVEEYKALSNYKICTLGDNAIGSANAYMLGKRHYLAQHKIAFEVGPINYDTYKKIWPKQSLLVRIKEFIAKLVPAHLDVDLKVTISNKNIPLMAFQKNKLKLGLNTFMYAERNVKPHFHYQITI